MQLSLVIGPPLPAEAVACLQENGFLPSSSTPAESPPDDATGPTPVSPLQGQLFAALTRRPLNESQIKILAIYWNAQRDGEPALSVDEVACRLAGELGIDTARAADFVRGALRSFGRRLLRTLHKVPLRISRDRRGGGVADEVPLLGLFTIETGPNGEARHRLKPEGAAAVALALGLTAEGHVAGGSQSGDPALDDRDTVVAVGMSRRAANLLLRVQRSLGLSLDETVKTLSAQAGAG